MLVRFGRSFSEKTAGILAVFRGFFPEKSAEDDWQMASNCQSYLLTDPYGLSQNKMNIFTPQYGDLQTDPA